MVAKMVSPSNDFGVYGQIYGHKGTGMNLFDVWRAPPVLEELESSLVFRPMFVICKFLAIFFSILDRPQLPAKILHSSIRLD